VKLLTRYVIREHVGPLLFALSALTSLLMLQYVARQLANLAGKGLPWSAIGTFFVLSIPFTVAMTLPMAVLVATLHAFGRMAAEHEITAFKASGVRVRALMLPVLGCAFLLSLFMVWFNDQVLPASNHRLRILQQDIARTRPTLALREQVLNPITDQFFMRVARTNAQTNRMYDVVIYDLTRGPERKTIYADSGVFMLDRQGGDLLIQLYDGYVQEFVRGDARKLQRSFFRTQVVRQRGIAQGFQQSRSDAFKGDREMTVCEMHRRYRSDAVEYERIRQEYIGHASRLATPGQKTLRAPRERPRVEGLAAFYCDRFVGGIRGTMTRLRRQLLPKTVKAQPPDPATLPLSAPPVSPVDTMQLFRGAAQASLAQLSAAREAIDGLSVEIHKKFALSLACVVFVLFGPPIALRFPRGGAGVTIGVSIVVFGLYYICLMGGEALADKGRLPAFVAMWIANVIFTLAGLVLLWRVETTTDRSRAGGPLEWWSDWRTRRAIRRGAQPPARVAG
jgi:lipopolysaccharide export system permease protein